jgi:hypothetical protein
MEELKNKLNTVEKKIEELLDEARSLESNGQEVPQAFWDCMDNASDEINCAKAAILRKL